MPITEHLELLPLLNLTRFVCSQLDLSIPRLVENAIVFGYQADYCFNLRRHIETFRLTCCCCLHIYETKEPIQLEPPLKWCRLHYRGANYIGIACTVSIISIKSIRESILNSLNAAESLDERLNASPLRSTANYEFEKFDRPLTNSRSDFARPLAHLNCFNHESALRFI